MPVPHTEQMDLMPWQTVLLILSVTILILKVTTGRRGRKLNLPPGPKPWPIIGNLNLIGSLPHRSLHELSKKYGPLMHLQFGSRPVVIASSIDMAKLILKTHDNIFASRPKTGGGKHMGYDSSVIVWSPYGPYWRQARKICVSELFSAKRLESYEYIRVEENRNMLRDLYKTSGSVVVLKEYISTVSLNVISRMMLGKKYMDQGDNLAVVSAREFKEMLEELFFLIGATNIGDYIPWLDFLDLQGYIKRMKTLHVKIDRFFEHILDEHCERRKEDGDKFVAMDMVDVLLQLVDDQSMEVKFKRHSVKAFMLDMLGGGTDTSTVTLEWAFSELLKHPHIFKKAIEELNRVIGKNRWVEEKDLQQLPFIEAVMKETMRLHPVAPLLIPHLSIEDVTMNGYDIASGTRVLVNIWTIGRDPSIWDAPEEFRPERFIGSAIDVKGHNYELLPFGTGRRMCPGYNLGLKVVQLNLANLLHGFNWSLPVGKKVEELSMEEKFGLTTLRKIPLEVVVEPKLATHLYGV